MRISINVSALKKYFDQKIKQLKESVQEDKIWEQRSPESTNNNFIKNKIFEYAQQFGIKNDEIKFNENSFYRNKYQGTVTFKATIFGQEQEFIINSFKKDIDYHSIYVNAHRRH